MGTLHINSWFIFIVLSLVFLWKLDFFTTLLNMRAFQPGVPAEFADVIDDEKYEETRDYVRARTVLGIGDSVFSLVLLFVFWWCGGFGWLDEQVRAFGFGPIVTGLIYLGTLFLVTRLAAFPFSCYSTFGIEAKFGFNKTTLGLFLKDFFLGLVLMVLLGAPLLAGLLWIFEKVPQAWLWGWIVTSATVLFYLYLAPTLIMPLFNKFSRLEDGELKTQIMEMARRCDFPLSEISLMNGSIRSTKGNAFFTGFGSSKRIALFDTLVQKHEIPELVSVLAHEIGHYKKKHIRKSLIFEIIGLGCLFALLGWLMQNRELFDAFAVRELSVYVSFVLFGILISPVNQVLSIGGNWLSRKNEFEADAFARDAVGSGEPLIAALKKLSVDNKSNLTPHPVYVFLNYTHPPAAERIRSLRAR